MHKSHAFLQQGMVFALTSLGHKVTICDPLDGHLYNPADPIHRQIKQFCRVGDIYTDFNIWTTSREKDFKIGGHKFDCFLHSDGHYRVNQDEYDRFNNLPFNYYLRAGMDAAETIAKQLKRPTYGFYDNGIDTKIFKKFKKEQSNTFVFMLVSQTIFPQDLRGLDCAVQAFSEEFNKDEDVVLILRIAEYSYPLQVLEKSNRKLHYISGLYSLEDMAKFYTKADCLLSPIRGALWEAPVLQAMACGTPAIATNAGGPGMYIKSGETGFLTSYEWVSQGDMPYKEPSLAEFKHLMRNIYENRKTVIDLGEAAAEDVTKYTYEYMATKLVEFFEGSQEFIKDPV
jgi:glycosyltransferase involved in cell wall biosynthesis